MDKESQAAKPSPAEVAAQESIAVFFENLNGTILPDYYRLITASMTAATSNLAARITQAMKAENLPFHEDENKIASLTIMTRATRELAKNNGADITNTINMAPDVKAWMQRWQKIIYNRMADETGIAAVTRTNAPAGVTSTPATGVPGGVTSGMPAAGTGGSASGSSSGPAI